MDSQTPQPLPTSDARKAQPEHFKLHHSYIWMALVSFILGGFAVLVMGVLPTLAESSSLQSSPMKPLVIMGAFLLYLVICVVVRILAYRNIWYVFDEREFSYYSGIISKNRIHVPYERIQSINHTASLFQRIIGVCSVKIETAGGAGNKPVLVPFVTNAAAELIRRECFARKAQAANGAAPTAPASNFDPLTGEPLNDTARGIAAGTVPIPVRTSAPNSNVLDESVAGLSDVRGIFGGASVETGGVVSYEQGLSTKELVLSGVGRGFGPMAGAILGLIGIMGTFCSVLPSSMNNSLFDMGANAVVGGVSSMAIVGVVAFALTITLVVIVCAWIMGIIGSCISYGGFKVRRRGRRIEVEAGLLSRGFSGIDIDRVQSVNIKRNLFHRIFKCCEVSLGRIDSATGNSEAKNSQQLKSSQGLVLHPFLPVDRVDELLHGLVPEYADVPKELTKLSPKALRRGLVRGCVWRSNGLVSVLIGIIALIVVRIVVPVFVADSTMAFSGAEGAFAMGMVDSCATCLIVLGVLILIYEAIRSVLWARESGFAMNHGFVTVRNSGVSITQIYIRRDKIQYGYTRCNPFQSMAHVATLHAVTAAGVGHTDIELWDVSEDDAHAWLDWVRPQVKAAQ